MVDYEREAEHYEMTAILGTSKSTYAWLAAGAVTAPKTFISTTIPP